MFDEKYWAKTSKSRTKSCHNCGLPIKKLKSSSTGWTHDGPWQGIRCQNMLCGATPAGG